MYPVLFKFGSIAIYSYTVMVSLGLAAGFLSLKKFTSRHNLNYGLYLDSWLYLAVMFFLGARLLFVFTNYQLYISDPLRIFNLWEGGVVFYGGLIFLFPAGVLLTRKYALSPWITADLFVLVVVIGLAFGRIGCFLSGCCHGIPTGLPWGIALSHPHNHALIGIPLHPTQLYSSVFLFGLYAWLVKSDLPGSKPGKITVYSCLSYPAFRFLVEFLRGDTDRGEIWGISTSQFISLLLFTTGIILLLLRYRQHDGPHVTPS